MITGREGKKGNVFVKERLKEDDDNKAGSGTTPGAEGRYGTGGRRKESQGS